MECIAVINQKGGVGKTATAVSLGAALALRNRRVLLIDLDPQGHLTAHFGLESEAIGRGAYEALTGSADLEGVTHPAGENLSVIPSGIDLAAAEVELVSVVGREVILRDMLAQRDRPYDVVLMDCPPSLGILTLNALSAATRVLIPLQPHFLALQGVGRLLDTVSLVSQRLNRGLTVAGVVLCMYESATRLASEVVSDLSGFLEAARSSPVPWRDARIFQTRIRKTVKLAECPSFGQTIFQYAPRSTGAQDYLALADELIALLDGRVICDDQVSPVAPVSVVDLPAATAGDFGEPCAGSAADVGVPGSKAPISDEAPTVTLTATAAEALPNAHGAAAPVAAIQDSESGRRETARTRRTRGSNGAGPRPPALRVVASDAVETVETPQADATSQEATPPAGNGGLDAAVPPAAATG